MNSTAGTGLGRVFCTPQRRCAEPFRGMVFFVTIEYVRLFPLFVSTSESRSEFPGLGGFDGARRSQSKEPNRKHERLALSGFRSPDRLSKRFFASSWEGRR